MRIALGSDHAGFPLKEAVADFLRSEQFDFRDFGTYSADSVDYPDIAYEVAEQVASGAYDRGILVCGSGVGVCITANKVREIRAALCDNLYTARISREHNDANVLCLGSRVIEKEAAVEVVRTWLSTPFSGVDRHARRIAKIELPEGGPGKVGLIEIENCVSSMQAPLEVVDPEVANAIRNEERRQHDKLVLIASENYASRAVMEAQGSVLTNKYAEGYPGRRYYGGCEYVDVVERLAIERAKQLYGAEHANVQPHAGAQANMAAYFAVMQFGDTYMALDLAHGGHLTHGSPVNFSGKLYNAVHYGVEQGTEVLNYDRIREIALQCRPKLIVTGATVYPRIIDFRRFREIADEVGAVLMVDMAHIAGLVAAGEHPSPVPHSQIVTTTTHKTLRGPRAGLILCNSEWAERIDRAVFPGTQGGPLMHVIAAKAVGFKEAMTEAFRRYQAQIRRNARALAEELSSRGFRLVAGGTDNHLMLVDLTGKGMTGKAAQELLDDVGIVVNKNMIPFDKEKPFIASGIRIGTPAVTTRGMAEREMAVIADLIADALEAGGDESRKAGVRKGVKELCDAFPMYGEQVS